MVGTAVHTLRREPHRFRHRTPDRPCGRKARLAVRHAAPRSTAQVLGGATPRGVGVMALRRVPRSRTAPPDRRGCPDPLRRRTRRVQRLLYMSEQCLRCDAPVEGASSEGRLLIYGPTGLVAVHY